MIKNANTYIPVVLPLVCAMLFFLVLVPGFQQTAYAWSADVNGARDADERVCRNGAQNIYDVLSGLAESAKETSERAADKALETAIQSLGSRETNPRYDIQRQEALDDYDEAISDAETAYSEGILDAASRASAALGNCNAEYNAREKERARARAEAEAAAAENSDESQSGQSGNSQSGSGGNQAGNNNQNGNSVSGTGSTLNSDETDQHDQRTGGPVVQSGAAKAINNTLKKKGLVNSD